MSLLSRLRGPSDYERQPPEVSTESTDAPSYESFGGFNFSAPKPKQRLRNRIAHSNDQEDETGEPSWAAPPTGPPTKAHKRAAVAQAHQHGSTRLPLIDRFATEVSPVAEPAPFKPTSGKKHSIKSTPPLPQAAGLKLSQRVEDGSSHSHPRQIKPASKSGRNELPESGPLISRVQPAPAPSPSTMDPPVPAIPRASRKVPKAPMKDKASPSIASSSSYIHPPPTPPSKSTSHPPIHSQPNVQAVDDVKPASPSPLASDKSPNGTASAPTSSDEASLRAPIPAGSVRSLPISVPEPTVPRSPTVTPEADDMSVSSSGDDGEQVVTAVVAEQAVPMDMPDEVPKPVDPVMVPDSATTVSINAPALAPAPEEAPIVHVAPTTPQETASKTSSTVQGAATSDTKAEPFPTGSPQVAADDAVQARTAARAELDRRRIAVEKAWEALEAAQHRFEEEIRQLRAAHREAEEAHREQMTVLLELVDRVQVKGDVTDSVVAPEAGESAPAGSTQTEAADGVGSMEALVPARLTQSLSYQDGHERTTVESALLRLQSREDEVMTPCVSMGPKFPNLADADADDMDPEYKLKYPSVLPSPSLPSEPSGNAQTTTQPVKSHDLADVKSPGLPVSQRDTTGVAPKQAGHAAASNQETLARLEKERAELRAREEQARLQKEKEEEEERQRRRVYEAGRLEVQQRRIQASQAERDRILAKRAREANGAPGEPATTDHQSSPNGTLKAMASGTLPAQHDNGLSSSTSGGEKRTKASVTEGLVAPKEAPIGVSPPAAGTHVHHKTRTKVEDRAGSEGFGTRKRLSDAHTGAAEPYHREGDHVAKKPRLQERAFSVKREFETPGLHDSPAPSYTDAKPLVTQYATLPAAFPQEQRDGACTPPPEMSRPVEPHARMPAEQGTSRSPSPTGYERGLGSWSDSRRSIDMNGYSSRGTGTGGEANSRRVSPSRAPLPPGPQSAYDPAPPSRPRTPPPEHYAIHHSPPGDYGGWPARGRSPVRRRSRSRSYTGSIRTGYSDTRDRRRTDSRDGRDGPVPHRPRGPQTPPRSESYSPRRQRFSSPRSMSPVRRRPSDQYDRRPPPRGSWDRPYIRRSRSPPPRARSPIRRENNYRPAYHAEQARRDYDPGPQRAPDNYRRPNGMQQPRRSLSRETRLPQYDRRNADHPAPADQFAYGARGPRDPIPRSDAEYKAGYYAAPTRPQYIPPSQMTAPAPGQRLRWSNYEDPYPQNRRYMPVPLPTGTDTQGNIGGYRSGPLPPPYSREPRRGSDDSRNGRMDRIC